MQAAGIYIHIPFCRRKCLYCDFPSYEGLERFMEPYAAALERELACRHGALPGAVFDSVYIGGGTPTALPVTLLAGILEATRALFPLAADAEITVEVNPGTADAAAFAALARAGVNRLSFGVQSFDDALLLRLGRIHTARQAEESILAARQAGFGNLSLDLMYGLPGQRSADLERSVEQALALGLQHISVYGLQVEDGTPFAALRDAGKLALPDEAEEDVMYTYLTETLPQRGWRRYEISNYARAGFESRHNLKYWQDAPYLGFGAAAHSYAYPRRFANVADVQAYIAFLKEGKLPVGEEKTLDRAEGMEEFCFLALRTAEGISFARFAAKFGCNFFAVYGHSIEGLQRDGFVEQDEKRLWLTPRGMRYGNRVFAAFLLK